ncbi:Glycosyltransferase, catalytic subunit of cellulose synthase and poly-beta-1,6-N-acetylglucosamine synthase [Hyunsoonleella jejuensis]|uniref:Glycosyltransferase, catalytic subunit of cellulose synthase and poly-beta-1,6-N-acetylglucosamine synthase n=1 Tax=Hyunsoonleella jejuensis TaxID=419940 RepID=A0A1H9C924_9FLAO|nr:glycosyltransferase [Hyunsoonleella jejuensis]SEP97654.1 Glycosyltransferase, catalytic subunit of cellulose synthase and poly-beta-1,6-N-acetylglucosamine synthase [Hyunsoonleella jejuensis]
MIILSVCIALVYLVLIGGFAFGFDKVSEFFLNDAQPKTKFSIVVPFRNEAENLPRLLKSLNALKYPKHLFEVILVDDASEDNSIEIIKKLLDTFRQSENTRTYIHVIKNIRTSNSPKKDAIATAIKHAKHEWIITTDADCIFSKFWLDSFDAFIQTKNPIGVIGPVTYLEEHTFLSRFQELDLLSLQGATIGAFGINNPFLCNGANFAYTKSVFNEVNGFYGNTNISSGDDIFLLEKIIKKYSKSVQYLKCEKAIVATKPQASWQALIQQRMRWAAKTSTYNNSFGKLVGITVFLMNLQVLLLPLFSVFGLFNIKIWVYILVIKLSIDFLLLYKTSAFFNQRRAFVSFLTSFSVYPFFSVYVAVLSLFKGYTWKGRAFKR